MRRFRPQFCVSNSMTKGTIKQVSVASQGPRKRHQIWKGVSLSRPGLADDHPTSSPGHMDFPGERGGHVGIDLISHSGLRTEDSCRGGWKAKKQLRPLHKFLWRIHYEGEEKRVPGMAWNTGVGGKGCATRHRICLPFGDPAAGRLISSFSRERNCENQINQRNVPWGLWVVLRKWDFFRSSGCLYFFPFLLLCSSYINKHFNLMRREVSLPKRLWQECLCR